MLDLGLVLKTKYFGLGLEGHGKRHNFIQGDAVSLYEVVSVVMTVSI